MAWWPHLPAGVYTRAGFSNFNLMQNPDFGSMGTDRVLMTQTAKGGLVWSEPDLRWLTAREVLLSQGIALHPEDYPGQCVSVSSFHEVPHFKRSRKTIVFQAGNGMITICVATAMMHGLMFNRLTDDSNVDFPPSLEERLRNIGEFGEFAAVPVP